MKTEEITPLFVENIPTELQEGVLYISDQYETAVHLCACGCKQKTVTPLSKDEWKLTNTDGITKPTASTMQIRLPGLSIQQ